MPRMVVDTNVYVSALNFGGAPDEVLAEARAGRVRLFISRAILTEIEAVLVRKFRWSPRQTTEAITLIRRFATAIVPRESVAVTISPSYVGEPECNGVAERFMRTLKEQCIYLHQFRSLEEAQQIIGAFIARYNAEWLVERLGHRTPAQARAEAPARAA